MARLNAGPYHYSPKILFKSANTVCSSPRLAFAFAASCAGSVANTGAAALASVLAALAAVASALACAV